MHVSQIQAISVARSKRWHDNAPPWSTLEWAGAMCGEAGEAANVAKKLKRHDAEQYNGTNTTFERLDREKLKTKLAQECADVFLYLVLLADNEGINLEQAIVHTFNQKSIEAGFSERLDPFEIKPLAAWKIP